MSKLSGEIEETPEVGEQYVRVNTSKLSTGGIEFITISGVVSADCITNKRKTCFLAEVCAIAARQSLAKV